MGTSWPVDLQVPRTVPVGRVSVPRARRAERLVPEWREGEKRREELDSKSPENGRVDQSQDSQDHHTSSSSVTS